MSTPKRQQTYFSNGQALQSPPFSVRITRFLERAYIFLGLYFVSLFSLDVYASAQASQFNIYNNKRASNGSRFGVSSGSWGGGGSGGGGPPGPGSGPGRRIGRVDDVRGPECGGGTCRG
ncbi:uncharacterized protein N7498_007195 [Penicillium cinerascens]|uniref:Uncharacterized protein n=1 Tax=Penicillium cinerascens TaxID=70096 RepID=A0A9W9JJM1_9EURO|nr:uncharacterized protein N7498_007195 [Penicillium cinerascens]KAJ5198078.1 hypothetical protein N7498_007195 [Penicillium cinerascens]